MRFDKQELTAILAELGELPSDWMDDTARLLVDEVRTSVEHFRQLGRKPTDRDLQDALRRNSSFLDVCRLFLGKGQEAVAHMLCDELGGARMTWSRLRSLSGQEPERIATTLVHIGIADAIHDHLSREWTVEDVLLERYKMSRGRAIAGQKRGRALEDGVETALRGIGVPFESRVTFVGKKGTTAKCDFAVPEKSHPKVVIEAKGFEATGSKLTDFLGDVLKIGEAKEYHMYFLLVTDGRGWHNRQSDLKKLVEYQNEGLIDMIYTVSMLPQLAAHVKHIWENE